MFGDHGNRNSRIFDRRKGDKQGVIQQMLGQVFGVVLCALRQGEHLRSAGLAGDPVFRADADPIGGAALDDMDHAVDHRVPVAGILDGDRRRGPGLLQSLDPGAGIFSGVQYPRQKPDAALREGGGGMSQLQWGRQKIALADPGAQGVAGNPALLVGFALPGLRRQHSALFAGQIDLRGSAHAELIEKIVGAVDADIQRQIIKVHIAGLGNRPIHVDTAVAAAFPVAELVAAAGQAVETGTKDRAVTVDHPVIESRQRH